MATITTPEKIGTEFLIKGGAGYQTNPVLAPLKNGGYVATWLIDSGVIGQRYNADGSKVGMEFMVSKSDKGQENQKVIGLSDDGFVVAWEPNSDNLYNTAYQVFDKDGNKVGGIVANKELYPQNIDLSPLPKSGFLAAWHGQRDGSGGTRFQLFDSAGNPKSEVILVSGLNGTEVNVIALDNGNFVINNRERATIYNGSLEKIVDVFKVNSLSQYISFTKFSKMGDSGFIGVWEVSDIDGDSSGVFAQRFNANGERIGAEFQVNTYTKLYQSKPAVTLLSDGGFVITWESYKQETDKSGADVGNGIYAQRFDMNNNPVGEEFHVNTTVKFDQTKPNIIFLNDGNLVVAWESRQNGVYPTSDYDIYAQRFDVGLTTKPTTDTKPTDTTKPSTPDSTSTNTSSSTIEGTSKADKLQGDDGNNVILGLAGDDTLIGGAGDDILKGGAGKDVLIGGIGSDILIGGAGADVFKFNSLDEMGDTEETADVIVDFNSRQKDKIDLSGIDADENKSGDQAFKLVKSFGDDATGQLVFDAKTGILYGSVNEDSDAEFMIILAGVTSLKAADFVL